MGHTNTTVPAFKISQLMDWTIMPAKVMALAWTDEKFKQRLFEDPTKVLQERVKLAPQDMTFRVHEDTSTIRHFVLPVRKGLALKLPKDQVLKLLKAETGDENDFQWFLPASIIVESFFDAKYKIRLMEEPQKLLSVAGYSDTKRKPIIVENTTGMYNLILPINPLRHDNLSFEQLKAYLYDVFGADSTKCCATGTCS